MIQYSYIPCHSRLFMFWTISELSSSGPCQNFPILKDSRVVTFWTIPDFFTYWIFPEFSSSGTFKNFYILDYSQISTFWTIPKFLCSEPLINFQVLHHARISLFWTILECLHSGSLQKYDILDHSQVFTFWTIQDFFLILDSSRTSTFWTIPGVCFSYHYRILHSLPVKIFVRYQMVSGRCQIVIMFESLG